MQPLLMAIISKYYYNIKIFNGLYVELSTILFIL